MKTKWDKFGELLEYVSNDDSVDFLPDDLNRITYAPNIGYYCWIFKYKGVLVALHDIGNGHYSVYSMVNRFDVLKAKLYCLFDKFMFWMAGRKGRKG